jgi:hypothetical protein
MHINKFIFWKIRIHEAVHIGMPNLKVFEIACPNDGSNFYFMEVSLKELKASRF